MSLPIFSRECPPFCPSIFSFYSPRSDRRQIDKFLNHCHFFFWAGEPRKVSPKSRGYPQLSSMLFSDFPWNKPSSYWGTPIYGTPIFYICFTHVFFYMKKSFITYPMNQSSVIVFYLHLTDASFLSAVTTTFCLGFPRRMVAGGVGDPRRYHLGINPNHLSWILGWFMALGLSQLSH